MTVTAEPVEAGTEGREPARRAAWTGKIYSDGWVVAPAKIETTEPATGEVLGEAGGGDAKTIAKAAKSAAAAQSNGRRRRSPSASRS